VRTRLESDIKAKQIQCELFSICVTCISFMYS